MCFGEKHSWLTFIFGATFVGLSAFKYCNVSKDALVIIIIMGIVVMMQLWEALAWRGWCTVASWGAYITILSQTMPLFLLMWPLKQQLGTLAGKAALFLMILYYGTVFIGSGKPGCILSDNRQIRYTWFYKWWQKLGYLIVFGAVPLLLMSDLDIMWFWIIMFYSSLIVTQLVYGELYTNGSIWCYYGAASSILLFVLLYYKYGTNGTSRNRIISIK